MVTVVKQIFYLRLAASEVKSFAGSRNKRQLWVTVVLPISLTILISASSYVVYVSESQSNREKESGEDLLLFDVDMEYYST
ncbi:hypothetical protein HHK36_027043 [Tetracentron sinense]|uniref:Uncharacterized protein n=1 Tax=Tetracentron sinense TaxID=13715 RepID=A0A834YGP3_TETSI|nr:hypothetical protein HHK36_027043 [Tetracentron sinense]